MSVEEPLVHPGTGTPYASFGSRLVAEIVDNLVTTLPFAATAAIGDVDLAVEVPFLASVIVALVYNGYLDGVGQTLGKRLMKIRVADAETGEPIGFGRGATRAALPTSIQVLGALVPLLGLLGLVDGLSMLRHERRQTWHDRLAGTVVLQWRAGDVIR